MNEFLFKHPKQITFVLLLALSVGCTMEGESKIEEVRKIVSTIIDADNNKNIEKVMSLYSNNAILLPPGEDQVMGHSSIKLRYEYLFDNFDLKLETNIEEVMVDGNWAFVSGTNSGYTISLKDSSKNKVNDKYIMILEPLENTEWKISHLIWNAGPEK